MFFHCMVKGSAPAVLPALSLFVTLSGERNCSLLWKRGSSLTVKPSTAAQQSHLVLLGHQLRIPTEREEHLRWQL